MRRECCLPLSTIFPNKFLPRRKFRVEQFHRRFRNWCWHSLMAMFALLTSAANTPGFSRTSRLCFRRSVVCTAGSMYMMPDVSGEMLFGSPTFAMPLETREMKESVLNSAGEIFLPLFGLWVQTSRSIAHRIRIVVLLRMLVTIDRVEGARQTPGR